MKLVTKSKYKGCRKELVDALEGGGKYNGVKHYVKGLFGDSPDEINMEGYLVDYDSVSKWAYIDDDGSHWLYFKPISLL